MARKIDILAPHTQIGQTALTLSRWLKTIGDTMVVNEPIAELIGESMVVYVHAPDEGVLSSMAARQGQNIISGMILGQISVVAKDRIEWENFDLVADLIEEFAVKAHQAKDRKQSKDANEALGQLLGVTDNAVFQNMDIEEQNRFLQKVVDEQKQKKLTPADVTQKLLEGLYLRMPANAPRGPAGPSLGLQGPAGPGMSGGGGVGYTGITPQQQQGYAPRPLQAPPLTSEQNRVRAIPGHAIEQHDLDDTDL